MELLLNGIIFMAKSFWIAILAVGVATAIIDKVSK
jgi:hypothetical protein